MKKASPESHEDDLQAIRDWTTELERLQGILPVQKKVNELRDQDIPALRADIKKLDAEVSAAGQKAQTVRAIDLIALHHDSNVSCAG